MPKKTKTNGEKPKIRFKTYKFKVIPTGDTSPDSVLSVAAARKSNVDINKMCPACGTRVEKDTLTSCSCSEENVCNECCSICQGGEK
ncbi:MAG: hypothetical protein PHT79_08920 [Syntrophomonadaceae bacterium]|nr:hypothetical protein [Syntrophomonadaceae bacterium]MDD3889301.1 hypothetical protein [Syntrophomonadaceae bacterium]MDD4549862.1 hypothetical protein [Syntrophomonadaceae bacterium]